MKHKLSLITFISMISVAMLFSVSLLYTMVAVSSAHAKKTEKELRVLFIKRQKEVIKQEVGRLVIRIENEKREVDANARKSLRHMVSSAFDFVYDLSPATSEQTRHDEIIHLLSTYRWEYNSGYYFVLDRNGNILFDGGHRDLIGKNIFTSYFRPDLKTFLRKVYSDKQSYGTYAFMSKNIKKDTLHAKLAFAKYDPSLGLLIGACVRRDELDADAQQIILSEIKNDKYGFEDSGYFMIFTPQFKTIYHPSKEFSSSDIGELQDMSGQYFIRSAVKAAKNGGGFITYDWTDPVTGVVSPKVSYVHYLPGWNWVVGTGFYFTSFNEMAASEQRVIQQTMRRDMYSNIALICALLGFTLLIAIYITKKLRHVEKKQVQFINDLEQYKNVLDNTSIVSMTDPSGHIIYVNDKFCEISGYSREFLLGKKHNVMRHPDTPNELFKDLWGTISAGQAWHGIIKNLRADGSHFYHSITILPYMDEHGRISRYTSCSQDITELIENRERLHNVFTTDRLTGLGNRYKMLNDLEMAKMPALAFVDIDRFHEINELYGMQQGDRLLTMVAEKMLSINELKTFNIYRLHSDVFAVMAPYIDMNVFINRVDAGMQELAKDVHILDGKEIYITFRIGFSGDRDDTASKADIALQMAKSQNMDHVIYDINSISAPEVYEKNIRISKMISSAVENDKVVPFYQPIYNFSTGIIEKYECLIRIIGDDGSIISPAQFLDVSKQTRLYPKLTSIVVKKSIDTFRNLNKEFSINLSAEDLLNSATMDYIFDYAKQTGVMDRLCIELLETEQLSNNRHFVDIISKFKQEGAKIAIDDFGTGYSNFDYLLKIQADYIKIDGSIIKLITKDDRAVDLVNSMVRYAKKMGLKTIGEFISDKDIAQKAKLLKVDYAQGYYFGKPMPEPAEEPENTL